MKNDFDRSTDSKVKTLYITNLLSKLLILLVKEYIGRYLVTNRYMSLFYIAGIRFKY